MAPESSVSDKVSEQLLSICRRNSARAVVPLLLAMLLTYVVLQNKVDTRLLQFWLLASCSSIVFRVIMLRVVSASTRLSGLRKRQFATGLTLILGCTVSSVLYFFPDVGLFERAMLTAILLGLCTVSYSTNFGYQPLLLSYIGPMLGVLSLVWMINSGKLVTTSIALAVGISVLIVAHTLMRNGKFMFEVFALAIESKTKLEEQSRRLSDALENAERAKQAAETSSQSKTRFIAAASHDLRQPVHVLNLFGGALKHAELDDKSRDIVDNMNVAVNSLSSQLNSLLDMSELDSGSVQPDIDSINLHELCATLMGELSKLAEDKQIALHNQVPRSFIVKTDHSMLSQIIRNLCGNAIKYTAEGSVTLAAQCTQTSVVLSISDTGIGIDISDSDKVFEEFYQVSNPSRDKAQGLGLGLSIVERLIKALGHRISLDSSPGVGTTVSIEMPRCSVEWSVQSLESAESTVVGQRSISLPEGFWVHIVDDDPAILASIRAFLLPLGCKVTGSQTLAEALDFLTDNLPSALLVDLRMQGEDSGLEVIDELTRKKSTIPVALITGESLTDGKIIEAYPDLVMLQKPVSNQALLELLDYMVTDTDVCTQSESPEERKSAEQLTT
jgi:signal transduction histidine kinase/FixJ family two-component response regulator